MYFHYVLYQSIREKNHIASYNIVQGDQCLDLSLLRSVGFICYLAFVHFESRSILIYDNPYNRIWMYEYMYTVRHLGFDSLTG